MERPFQAYQGNDPYVFVCYSHDDKALVYPEITRLKESGVNIWYDEGITPGSEWSDTIATHIERAAAFLYFVSPRSTVSEHCRREINYALEQPCGILAVHLEPTELPSGLKLTLSNRQAVLKYDDPQDVYETKLSTAIGDAQRQTVREVPAPGIAPPPSVRRGRLLLPSLAAVMALALLGLVVAYWNRPPLQDDSEPPLPRLALAEFTHSLGDEHLRNYAALLRDDLMEKFTGAMALKLVQTPDTADFVIRGSVSERSGGARLYIQLENARDGRVIWSKNLDLPAAPTEDLLDTRTRQVGIVASVAVIVWSNASQLTDSLDAARAFVAGMVEYFEATQGVGGSFNASIAHLRRSAELDPQFIEPLVLLSNHYNNRLYGRLRYAAAVGPAREYALRALAIDENQTLALANINLGLDLDYAAALANIEHARRVGFPTFQTEFAKGLVSLVQGRLEEAIDQFNAVLEIGAMDNTAGSHALIELAYLAGGQYEAAARAAEKAAVQTAGTGAYAHVPVLVGEITALYHSGDGAVAREKLTEAWSAYGVEYPSLFAGVLALLGETNTAREVLQAADERFEAGGVVDIRSCFWGSFYLDDLDQAFVWLDRAIEERASLFLPELRRSPLLDPIRDDPRFIAAMARLAELEAQGTPISSIAYP